MSFLERMNLLNRDYPKAYEDCDNYTESYIELGNKLNYRGAYSLWETGFSEGDASEEDIIADCKALGIAGADINEMESELYSRLEDEFIDIYERKLKKAEKEYWDEYWRQREVKLLHITDMKYNNFTREYTSKQVECFEDVKWNDGMLQDNGGDPDGNAWFKICFEEGTEEFNKAIEHGAEVVTAYKVDYCQNIREDLEYKVNGLWAGFTAENEAYFTDKDDALLCQKLYDRWYSRWYRAECDDCEE